MLLLLGFTSIHKAENLRSKWDECIFLKSAWTKILSKQNQVSLTNPIKELYSIGTTLCPSRSGPYLGRHLSSLEQKIEVSKRFLKELKYIGTIILSKMCFN